MRLLIVDDEAPVRAYIRRLLEKCGFECVEAPGPPEARRELVERGPGYFQIVLLDVKMPAETGFEFLTHLRAGGDDVPVILLTACGETEDRVRGLELGADDYVVKPFSGPELIARVEAVKRRSEALPIVRVGNLSLDLARRTVQVGEERIELSPREFDLLKELTLARGDLLSRRDLLERLWGMKFDPRTTVLEVQVSRLRSKLGRPGAPRIETVVGEGYRLVETVEGDLSRS